MMGKALSGSYPAPVTGLVIRLHVSSESSARQRIHLKNEALFSLKDKSKKLKCRLLQFLFGASTVKVGEQKFFCQSIQYLWIGPLSAVGRAPDS